MRKLPLDESSIMLNGMPWYTHSKKRLWRLPVELEDMVSRELWQESITASGGRIRFCSDTTLLGIQGDFCMLTGCNTPGHMGSMGTDAYVDGCFWSCLAPKAAGQFEGFFFENTARKVREFTLYLPLFCDVDNIRIIVDDNSQVCSPAPFSMEKPVVFYGTSITHGASASRPGLTYEAVLCRELGLDFVNLGFNGMGKGERAVAKAMAGIDASCFVLDFGQNNKSPREFEQVFQPFINEIRAIRPGTPMILTTPLPDTGELWKEEFRTSQEAKRQIVIEAYNRQVMSGDSAIYLAQWNQLTGLSDGDGLLDGCHPNDYGFRLMSKGLKNILQQALGLNIV